MSRDWEANTTSKEQEDREERRAAKEAAEHFDARVRDLPERIEALDEERRNLSHELDAVRERWTDLWWTSQADETLPTNDEPNGDIPTVRVIEFDDGELPDVQAFADRAMNENGITLIAAHGDSSFAVAVSEALTAEFNAENIACEIAEKAGGGAGGSARFASGGGATDALSEACQHIRENLVQADSIPVE